MTLNEITTKIDSFKSTYTDQHWEMDPISVIYDNDFIEVKRIDSSNPSGGTAVKAGKKWGIIIVIKKDFTHLPNWKLLKNYYEDDLRITKFRPKKHKELEGCYGIRFYKMSDNPTVEIILDILHFIFD